MSILFHRILPGILMRELTDINSRIPRDSEMRGTYCDLNILPYSTHVPWRFEIRNVKKQTIQEIRRMDRYYALND